MNLKNLYIKIQQKQLVARIGVGIQRFQSLGQHPSGSEVAGFVERLSATTGLCGETVVACLIEQCIQIPSYKPNALKKWLSVGKASAGAGASRRPVFKDSIAPDDLK